jgi:hypothetical protein
MVNFMVKSLHEYGLLNIHKIYEDEWAFGMYTKMGATADGYKRSMYAHVLKKAQRKK